MYGIRVALGHKSRTFGYPDTTLHVPTNPTAWTVSTTSRGQFRSTEVAERSPGTPQARWRWTTAVGPREASIVQHSCLHADPTNVVASPSSWSPQPRFPRRRAASIHYLRSEHITGRGPARYPHESMAVVIVVRVRAQHCICARHDRVNSSKKAVEHAAWPWPQFDRRPSYPETVPTLVPLGSHLLLSWL